MDFVDSTLRYLKYWLRFLKMEDIRISEQAYKMKISKDESEKKCWGTELRNVLSRNGFFIVFGYNTGFEMKRNF